LPFPPLAEPIPISEVVARAGAATLSAAPAVGFFAVIAAYQMIYGAYTGWHAPIYFVEEDANAVKNIPRAMGTARILYGMARDGLFLPVAMRVNKGGTPHIALAITAAFAVPLIFSGAFVFLFKLMAALAIFTFFLFEASLFALRRKQPDLHRPFRAFGYPLLPAFVCLLDLALLAAFIAADPMSGVYMLGLIAICVPVGIVLHRRRAAASRALARRR